MTKELARQHLMAILEQPPDPERDLYALADVVRFMFGAMDCAGQFDDLKSSETNPNER